MMSHWKISDSQDLESEVVLCGNSKRDKFDILIDNESGYPLEQNQYFENLRNVETSQNLGEIFTRLGSPIKGEIGDERKNYTRDTSERVRYFQSDESGVLKEISRDTIDLPTWSQCENMTFGKSNVATDTVQPEEQVSSDETELSELDNLLTLLGEPPKKKSVWDHFDMLMQNQPLAEHIAESDGIKSNMEKPIQSNPLKRTNSKRNDQRKLRFDLKESSDQVTILDIPSGDAPKVSKRASMSIKTLPNRTNSNANMSQNVNLLDCGDCSHCWDKKKFGVPGNLKKKCKKIIDKILQMSQRRQSDIGSGANSNSKVTHNQNGLIQLPRGVSLSFVETPKIPGVSSRFKTPIVDTKGNVTVKSNKQFLSRETSSNFLLEAENSTKNIEVPQMVIKYCHLCNFKTSQIKLLIGHMRQYHMEERLQCSNQNVPRRQEAEESLFSNVSQPVHSEFETFPVESELNITIDLT